MTLHLRYCRSPGVDLYLFVPILSLCATCSPSINLGDREELFEVLRQSVKGSKAEEYLLSIFQYLMLVRDDHVLRPKYYRLVADIVTQACGFEDIRLSRVGRILIIYATQTLAPVP